MPHAPTRILSDLHYGDRGSRLRSLAALRPLFDGAGSLVLNGDTLDTRPSRRPAYTAEVRAEVAEFFARGTPPATFLTGNHDPDISRDHTLDLAGGRVFVTHGDIIYEDLVPWGKDAPLVRRRIAEELARLAPGDREELVPRLGVYRRVAATIPQRHQSERGLKYAVGYLADTIWPPQRFLRILRAWQSAPDLAAALARRHRPQAGIVVIGHIHRPGIWRMPNGVTVINTGSYCPPLGAWVADVSPTHLTVREVRRRGREFRLGRVVAEFTLKG